VASPLQLKVEETKEGNDLELSFIQALFSQKEMPFCAVSVILPCTMHWILILHFCLMAVLSDQIIISLTTMTIGFLRPVGASGDVKEVEYISALHQTSPGIREDASITGKPKVCDIIIG
jgi:hypothetical protein